MKILFLSGHYPPNAKGGGEISTHLIAQALRARGHDVRVITQGQHEEHEEYEGVPVTRLPLAFTAKPLFERRHARRLTASLLPHIQAGEFDIIHAHDFRMTQVLAELSSFLQIESWAGRTPSKLAADQLQRHSARRGTPLRSASRSEANNAGQKGAEAAFGARIKDQDQPPALITTVRDYAQICGSPNNLLANGRPCNDCTKLSNLLNNQAIVEAPLIRKPFRLWQYRYNIGYRLRSFRAIPNHIYISHSQRDAIAHVQNLSGITTHVIYNPVPPDYLRTRPVQHHSRTILYVGTLQKYKGVDLLLEAFAQLAKINPNTELKIVGDGAQREHYQQWIGQHGLSYRITLTGRLPHHRLRELYDEAHIVVAPHMWQEPFGRSTAEALSRGKLVVAANHGGPAELIDDNKTGFLFESDNSQALAQRLQDVLTLRPHEQRSIQNAARAWATQHLNSETIAAQHEAAYNNVTV